MRLSKPYKGIEESDMTPMIDMTFQLIAFFMVIINFTEAEQDQRVQLPSSELAKPPDVPFEDQLTLQLTHDEQVIFSGEMVPMAQVRVVLSRERTLLERVKKTAADATVIIRADQRAKTGVVQNLIKECQEEGFEKFALRAMAQEATDG